MIRMILFWVFVGVTGYYGAQYRSDMLMTVSAAAAALGVILIGLSVHLNIRTEIRFAQEEEVVKKQETYRCMCIAKNHSRIPVRRVRVYVQTKTVSGAVNRTAAEKAWRGTGTIRINVSLNFPECGLYLSKIRKKRVWEPFAFFSAAGREKEKMEILVMPGGKALRISAAQSAAENLQTEAAELSDCFYDGQDEIRQMREYRSGDSPRHIHWNLSARTDQLWIKEYETQTETGVLVLLTNEYGKKAAGREADAFYEIAASLIHGLRQAAYVVNVCWYHPAAHAREKMDIRKQGDLETLFRTLYRMEKEMFLGDTEQTQASGWNMPVVRLDFCRIVYVKEKPALVFSEDGYAEELEQSVLIF